MCEYEVGAQQISFLKADFAYNLKLSLILGTQGGQTKSEAKMIIHIGQGIVSAPMESPHSQKSAVHLQRIRFSMDSKFWNYEDE
jgi:hypothetical protein